MISDMMIMIFTLCIIVHKIGMSSKYELFINNFTDKFPRKIFSNEMFGHVI